MQIIVLIPCLICAFALFRYSVPHVFLRYFLPFFVLFPSYYYWKISALPPITVGQSALLPIGAAIVLTLMRRWRFTTSDIWIGLFLLSTCVTEYKAERTTAAIFNLYYGVCEGLIPYMIGKVLIEQSGIRAATARRIVTLMTICGIISLYEYRMSINPFTLVWGRFFQNESFAWKTQLRWGFGRVSGPYGQSELAGMVILFGIMLAVWVSYAKPWPEKFPWFPNHPLNVKTIIFILLAIFLFTTQARGPWLGCLFALPIAFIGKSKHIWRNCVLFFGITLPILGFTYVQVKQHLVNADPRAPKRRPRNIAPCSSTTTSPPRSPAAPSVGDRPSAACLGRSPSTTSTSSSGSRRDGLGSPPCVCSAWKRSSASSLQPPSPKTAWTASSRSHSSAPMPGYCSPWEQCFSATSPMSSSSSSQDGRRC
ncbi:hypothetical protein ACFQBQ_12185 [Granulicella cerasi]|uniref:Uncharacterized protein n=1 Tax=Granulicella cerasi TaxID=741063 RepID=A0ABW1ZB63_9BACT